MLTLDELVALDRDQRLARDLLPNRAKGLLSMRGHRLDYAAIDDAPPWSSGELILIAAAKSITGDGLFRLADLRRLDGDNRKRFGAVIDSLLADL
jgi:hypothetical protein